MAVTISSTVTKGQTPSGTTSTTASSITVASGQSLVLGVVTDAIARTVSSAVFNSGAQSFSLVDTQNQGSPGCRCEVWEIASPTAGTGTVTVNVNTSGLFAFIVAVVDGADAGASYRRDAVTTSGNSTTPSLTITSATNDLAIAFIGNINTTSTATADASPVSQVAVVTSGTGISNVRMWLLQETGAASTSPSGVYGATRDWAAVGFNLNVLPAASGGGGGRLNRARRVASWYMTNGR